MWKIARSRLLLVAVIGGGLGTAWALEEKDLQQFIQEAIQAGGGEVVIPPGEHVIRKGLKVENANGLKIVGLEKEWTRLKWEGENEGTLLEIRGTAENVSIGKLSFTGNGKAQSGVTVKTKPDQSGAIRIEECLFEGGMDKGIELQGGESVTVENCTFRDLAKTGIALGEGVKEPLLAGNWMTRCEVGVLVANGGKVLLADNEFPAVKTVTLVEKGGAVEELTADQLRAKVLATRASAAETAQGAEAEENSKQE